MRVCGRTKGAHGLPVEAGAIGLILLLNAALGLYQEYRSEAALTRLKALAGARAWVVRDRQLVQLHVHLVVPGDLVRLEAGDRVPADGTLVDARGVMLDESLLTGESVPVDKGDGEEALSGTMLVRGRAYLEVNRTGTASAMGRLATMLADIQTGKTPLERRVDSLGRSVARGVLGLAAVLGTARRRCGGARSGTRRSSSLPSRSLLRLCRRACRRSSRWLWRSASSEWRGNGRWSGGCPPLKPSGR